MERGELSGDIPKRCLVIWEQGLADLGNGTAEAWALRMHRYKRAVRAWDLNQHMVDRVWDFWSRYNLRCDLVVTSRPPEFTDAVEDFLEAYDVPIRHCLTLTIEELGRRLIRMPDVHVVIHRDPNLLWAFSDKGRMVEFGKAVPL